jgi:hypothetical protein
MKRMFLGLAMSSLAFAAFAAPPNGAPPLGTVDVNVVNPVLPVEVSNAEPIPVTNIGPAPSLAVANVRQHFQGIYDIMPGETYTVGGIEGPGQFISAYVTKQGGASDITTVELFLDGVRAASVSFAGFKNFNLTQSNPSGLMVAPGATAADIDTAVIGFPYPLAFKTDLRIVISVGGSDTGIAQILTNVIAATE